MANRSNIMGLHGLKNKTSRNSFDLSHRNLFTAKVGELLPCFVQEVNPGDSIKLDSSYFTRTAPLQSAAFTRLRENVQYFFVPYQCLWKYFEGQVKNMTTNANGGDVSQIASSPFANQKVSTEMPFISYTALHAYVNKLLNYVDSSAHPTELSNPFLFNNGCWRHAETSKLLQMLGYGNFVQQYKNFSGSKPYSLLHVENSPALSVFRLLAYQKICNDFYTYRQWQPYNASLCNIDYISPDSSASMDLSSSFSSISDANLRKSNMLDMRFSNLPLDYFNGVLPTPQFASESVVNLNLGNASGSATISGSTGSDSHNWTKVKSDTPNVDGNVEFARDGHLYLRDNGSYISPLQHTHNINGLATINTSLSGSLSVLALRQATALQKYKEIQLANDPDFESQVEAHFGIKPVHDMHKSRFIGGASSMIDINPVVNQNLGTGSSLSNEAVTKAAPTGQGGANFKFTADTFGVVIGIYRCTPVLDYSHVGIDRTLLKTDASDFVIPELDSIGMQQTYQCELFAPTSQIAASAPDKRKYDMSRTYGYAPRYSEFKVSFDRYNGAFCDSLKSWVTGFNTHIFDSDRWNDMSHFLIHAPQLFVCRPDIVKDIFLIKDYYNSNDDNLYVGMVNMCYATRNLSRYGLPYSN
ncbi:MAG: major capsid protein [Microvirus sp.]|nr:MAG: major capsid protein [Microvirus sp.]